MRVTASGRQRIIMGLVVLAMAIFFVDFALGLAIGSQGPVDLVFPFLGLSFCLTGGLITQKRPENAIGWIMWAAGFLLLLQALALFYGILAQEEGVPFPWLADEAAWAQLWLWVPGFHLIAIVLFLFPDGKSPGAKWSWVLWLASTVLAGLVVAVAEIWPRRSVDFIGAEGLIGEVSGSPLLDLVANWGLITLVVIALAALVYRFIRSGHVVRQQLKWLVWGAGSAWIMSFIVAFTSPVMPIDNPLYLGSLFVAVISIPISTAIAVLRYRLYEIDRIISRTVAYVLVVAVLGLVVFGLIAGLAIFLPSDDPLVVAVATLVVFALFSPLRLRMQRIVDRRFNRSRYDTARVIDEFSGSLQDRVDPEGVVDGWVGVVEQTMQPATVGVWVRE